VNTPGPTRLHRGEILKVLSRTGGGAIFVLTVSPVRQIRVVVPYNLLPLEPQAGDIWRVEGRFRYSATHGSQLHATEAYIDMPRGAEIASFLGRNLYFAEVDLRTSKSAYKRLGDGLRLMLDAADYVGIAGALRLELRDAVAFCERWLDFWAEIRLRKVLVQASFSVSSAPLLFKFWGRTAANLLTDNPYRYLAFSTWRQVDSAALRVFNIDAESSKRLIGAVEATLYAASSFGDTALADASLRRLLSIRLGSTPLVSRAISLAIEHGKLITLKRPVGECVYQTTGLYNIESALRNRLSIDSQPGTSESQRSSGKHFPQGTLSISLMFAEGWSPVGVVSHLASMEEQSLHVVPDQSIVSGLRASGARTRITTITALFTDGLGRSVPKIIYVYGTEGFNVLLFSKLLHRLPASTDVRLVVRSKYQLAVGPGPVLQWLMSLTTIQSRTLMSTRRRPRTGIASLLHDIDVGRATLPSSNGYGGAFRLVPTSGWRETLAATVSEFYAAASAQSVLVILPLPEQCHQFNTLIHQESILYKRETGQSASTVKLRGAQFATTGEPIVCHKQVWELGLIPGALGTLLEVLDDARYEVRNGHPVRILAIARFTIVGEVTLTAENLSHISLAHALPVQRCQFASSEHVILPLTSSPVVDRLWVHKAVSCASEAVALIGDESIFARAVSWTRARRPRRFGALQTPESSMVQEHHL